MAASKLSRLKNSKVFFQVECMDREDPGTFWIHEKSDTPFYDEFEPTLRAYAEGLPEEERFTKRQFVAAKRNGKWFRGEVKELGIGAHSERLHIFMLDVGVTESVEKRLVRNLPSEYLQEPFRARKFCLYPLVPATQQVDSESLKLIKIPCYQWTPSAQAWCSTFFKKQWFTFVSVEGQDEEQVWYGRLYVSETPDLDRDNLTCLNELLRVEGFALEDYQLFPLTDWVPTSELWQTSPALTVGNMNKTTPLAATQVLPTVPLAVFSEEYARQKRAGEGKSKPVDSSTTSSWLLDNPTEHAPIPKGRGNRISSSTVPVIGASLNTGEFVEHKADTSVSVESFDENPQPESHSRRNSSQRVVFRAAGVNLTSAPKPLPPKEPARVLNKIPTTHFDHHPSKLRTPPVFLPSALNSSAVNSNSRTISPVAQKSQVSPSTSVMNMLSSLRKAKDAIPVSNSTSHVVSPPQTSPVSPTPSSTRIDLASSTAQLTSPVTQSSSPIYTVPRSPHSTQVKPASVTKQAVSTPAGPKSRLASLLEKARKAKQATVITPVPAQPSSVITPKVFVAPKEVVKSKDASENHTPSSVIEQREEKQGEKAVDHEEEQVIGVSKPETVNPANVETVKAELDVTRPIAGASVAAARRMAASGMFLPELELHKRVFVHGLNPVLPCKELQCTPLSDLLHRVIMNKPWNLSALSHLQSHTWGSLLRGRNVTIIGPPGAKKTWSYLIPLINNLLSPDEYTEIPSGCGPLAIILTASWEKAQSVYDDACELLRIQRDSVVRILYGGHLEGGRITSLSNGSTLIVATLPAFVRVLKHGPLVMNFDRCCHWVIEEADILCRYNQPEMEVVLKKYISSVKETKLPVRQIVAVGQEWTPSLASFVNCIENPLIYIGSPIEAAIFGGMVCRANIVRENNKEDLLLDLVGKALDHKKIMIFCESVKEVEYVAGLVELLGDNFPVIKAHTGMTRTDIHGVCQKWEKLALRQSAVLVTMDEVLATLAIQNAELLIHYHIPKESKTEFGLRLATAIKHFKVKASESNVPESVIFITDEVTAQLPTIVRFLRRTNAQVDPILKTRLREYLTESERSKKSLQLCLNTKLWGVCQGKSCPERHYVVKTVDAPILPTCGEVIISVSHVESATRYYARILQHINLQGKAQKLDVFDKIHSSIAQYYAEHNPKPIGGQLSVGTVCAVRKVAPLTGTVSYERVQVLRIFRDTHNPILPVEIDVQYIDHGKIQTQSPDDLVYLCPELASQPPAVAEIVLPNVKPIDRDETWNYEASSYVRLKVAKKELRGKIKLSLGNVLWLDPLVVQYRLDSHTVVNEWNVSRQLLFEGWAETNPVHLEKLYTFCAAAELPLPDYTQSVCKGGTCTGSTAFLPEGVIEEVHVSSIVSPSLFYIQRTTFSQCLDDLQDDIENYVAHLTKASLKKSKVFAGLICLAKFCLDDCWYRARVLKIVPGTENKVQVFYLDFGDLGEVLLEDLRFISDNFILKLPYQAIPCSLAGVSPILADWNNEAVDLFKHCTQEGLIFKTLHSRMRRKNETMEETVYEIGLYSEDGRNVATVLVDNDVARINEEGSQHVEWLEDITVELLHRQSDIEDGNVMSEDDENWKLEDSPDAGNAGGLDFLGNPLAFVSEALGENCPPELVKLMELERKAIKQENMVTYASQTAVEEVNNSTDTPPATAAVAQPVKTEQKPKLGEGFLVTAGSKAKSIAKDRLEARSPSVKWADLKSGVKVTVLLTGLKHYRFVNTQRSISFRAIVGGVKYVLSEKLYADIDPEKSLTQLQGYGLVIRLVKATEEADTKMPWLKGDFDAGCIMEEEPDEMLSLEECQKRMDEIRAKGAGCVTHGSVLDFDPDNESANSEEDSDEDPALDVVDNFLLV